MYVFVSRQCRILHLKFKVPRGNSHQSRLVSVLGRLGRCYADTTCTKAACDSPLLFSIDEIPSLKDKHHPLPRVPFRLVTPSIASAALYCPCTKKIVPLI